MTVRRLHFLQILSRENDSQFYYLSDFLTHEAFTDNAENTAFVRHTKALMDICSASPSPARRPLSLLIEEHDLLSLPCLGPPSSSRVSGEDGVAALKYEFRKEGRNKIN